MVLLIPRVNVLLLNSENNLGLNRKVTDELSMWVILHLPAKPTYEHGPPILGFYSKKLRKYLQNLDHQKKPPMKSNQTQNLSSHFFTNDCLNTITNHLQLKISCPPINRAYHFSAFRQSAGR